MWFVAFSTRLACTFEIAAAALSGRVACGGSGVVGSETSGGGMRLDRLSCDSCGSMFAVATPTVVFLRGVWSSAVRGTDRYQSANRGRQGL